MAANDPTMRVDIVYEATWNKILEAADNPLPKSTASDKGKYLHLNASTGKTEWVKSELPQKPETDGTYTLTCTVDDGTATLSWVSAAQEQTNEEA